MLKEYVQDSAGPADKQRMRCVRVVALFVFLAAASSS